MQRDAALSCLYPLFLTWKPQMIGAHLRLVIHVHTYPGVVPLSQRSGGCGWQLTGQLGIGTAWHHSVCSLLLFALLDSTSRTHSALWRVSPSFEVPCNDAVFLSWIHPGRLTFMEPTNHPFRKENDLPNQPPWLCSMLIFQGVRLGYVFLVVRYGLDCCPHRSHRWPKASSHLLHPTTGTNQPMKQEGMLEVSPEQVLFDSYVFFFFWERNLRKHFVSRAQWCLICTLFRVGELLIEFFKCACMSKVVVSIFLDFQLYSGKFSNLTSIFFQTGWNHQLDSRCQFSLVCCCWWLYFCSTKISINEEVGAP